MQISLASTCSGVDNVCELVIPKQLNAIAIPEQAKWKPTDKSN